MKRFRLLITDKFEDRPRLITAYGRVRGGEVGLVLRPLESKSLVVQIRKDDALLWENDVSAKPSQDVVREPTAAVGADVAVGRIQTAQKSPGKRGPATFRGQWTGVFVWDDGPPRVELRRKLASYGWLHIRSDEDGWRWMFDRQAKWFTTGETKEGMAYGTLVDAIDAGVAAGLGLVREACGVRDTTRKTAVEEPVAPPTVPRKRRARPSTAGAGSPRRKQGSKTSKTTTRAAPVARAPTKRRARGSSKPRSSAHRTAETQKPVADASCGCSETPKAPPSTNNELLMAAFARALDDALAA